MSALSFYSMSFFRKKLSKNAFGVSSVLMAIGQVETKNENNWAQGIALEDPFFEGEFVRNP